LVLGTGSGVISQSQTKLNKDPYGR